MIFQKATDEQLLSLIRGSNENAFTELYQRYWKRLYASSLKRMSGEEDAQDIVQELFVKLWRRRNELPEDIKVAEYLYTSLRYSVINYLQADIVRIKHANSLLHEREQSTLSIAEGSLRVEELEQIVEQAVESMPERVQEVFLLSYRNGLSPKEIAVALSLSVQTVKNYLSHARLQLKGLLKDQNEEVYPYLILITCCLAHS